MARTIAALIRHGDYKQQPETPSAHQPYALTAEGRAAVQHEAARFAERMEKQAWTISHRIDSSNMLRAWQTALIFAENLFQHEMPTTLIESHDALAERGVGSVANLTIQQIEKIIIKDPRYEEPPQNWKSDSYYCLPFQGADGQEPAFEHRYVDKNHEPDVFEFPREALVGRLVYIGDTKGDEAGTETGVTVWFNPIGIIVVEE